MGLPKSVGAWLRKYAALVLFRMAGCCLCSALYRTRPYISLSIMGIEVGSNQPLKEDLKMFQPRISVKIESCNLFHNIYISSTKEKGTGSRITG